jgi:pyruvate dehydrogenase E1 component alpha subunit
MASNWKLPALYVLENNGYGEFTPTEFVAQLENLSERAKSYGMCGVIADGMDFFDVYEKAGEAIERARKGEGPTLLECKTYRFYGHFVGDPNLDRYENRTVEAGLLSSDDLRRIDGEIAEEIETAVAEAEAAPLPQPEDVLTDVYVSE